MVAEHLIDVTLNIATVSETNAREHWRQRSARAKAQRQQARISVIREALRSNVILSMPLRVTFTRLSPRALDSDNLQAALKHIRDGVADAVGVDDRDPRYAWGYQQSKSKTQGVRITIEVVE